MASSKNTRMAHIVNLMSIAGIDGNISEDEKNVIVNIAQDLGLTEEEFDKCIGIWQNVDETKLETIVPDSVEEAYQFLKNMVLVMMIDGEIDENERAYIAGLAKQYGIDGEEIVDELIKVVYDEYFSDDDSEDEDEDEDEDDEEYEDEEEFDEEILKDAYIDTRLFHFTEEQLEEIQRMAENGNGDAQYVLGRYHFVVKPEDDSTDKAHELFDAAVENGNYDACASLAQMLAFGYYDSDDDDLYDNLIQKGLEEGSPMAIKMKLENMIYGRYGYKKDPKRVIDFLENDILTDDDEGFKYPYFYVVLGDAYDKLGNKAKAGECYEQASFADLKEADYKKNAVHLEGLNPMAREMYETVIDMDCDDDIPGCFTLRAMLLGEKYEDQDEETQEETAQKIIEALEHDHELGFSEAAAKLGDIYYYGEYGIERDPQEAWGWYYKGTLREDAAAFTGLATMVKDGVCPDNLPESFFEWCQLSAQRRSNGAPDKHYLAIIKPDGKTIAYCFIKDDWDKVAGYLGAKRLAPVRVDALDKIGKKVGISEHLTAWIDIEAPRKKMPMNAVAKKFYKGVIAGDIVLTMADDIWDPMLFMEVDDINNIVEALGGKLVDVIDDELALGKEKREYTKISADLLHSESGFVARIQPDNTAHIVGSNHKIFALTEEDIYDPVRLESLYKIGEKLGLKGRLTIWTDNSSLRKQMIMNNKNDMNAIGTKLCAGPVADNFFVAMEDENYNIMLFDDVEQLKNVVVAMGVKAGNIVKD